MARKAATVSQFNDYIDKSFRNDPILGNAYVIGQISDLTYHKSGHIYFSIMDEYSKLSCMMFKNNADLLKVKLEEGQEVIVSGYINVYKPRGTYSLVCRDIEVVG
ncbi:MAG: exodeoxyribonuclease VII large subunit, partial [Clostridia bacterium]|nr:exodeoxyribonuclease VII large subunit [Clostridia bacterium]